MATPSKQLQETDTFLNSEIKSSTKVKTRKWTKKKICLLSCLICFLFVLLVLGAGVIYIYTRGTKQGDADFWEDLLKPPTDHSQVEMTGAYNLVSFDDNYKEYLEGMGIPFFVVPLILQASEIIEITLDEESQFVTMKTITDWMTRNSKFTFDEEFSMTYGKGNMEGLMYNTCTRPQNNIIHCRSEEREKKWNFESEIVFSDLGMINKRTFFTKNIVTKKYYVREGADLDMAKMRKRSTAFQGLQEFATYSTAATEPWLEDDFFDDF